MSNDHSLSSSRKAPTIRDIARLAGVSHSTVSLVLNDNGRISLQTRQRVLDVMRRVGYAPNVMARSLVRRSSGMIAIVMPRTSSRTLMDSYFAEALSGISNVLADARKRLLIEFSTERFLEERGYLQLFRQRQIDGMLVLGTLTSDSFVKETHAAGYPVMLVNTRVDGIPGVLADNRTGVFEALEHLHALGHRRIAHVGGLTVTTVGQQRYEAFHTGMRQLHLDPERYLVWGDFSEESGRRAMQQLRDCRPLPTAILAGNDLMAVGVIRCLQDSGLRVPADVSVIGADDIGLARYIQPSLTTIRQSMHHVGELAARALLARIQGQSSLDLTVVPTSLVVRQSTGPVAG